MAGHGPFFCLRLMIAKYFQYLRGYLTSLRHFDQPTLIAQSGKLTVYCRHGKISVGARSRFWPNSKLSCEGSAAQPAHLEIGQRVQIGDNAQIHCGLHLKIDDDVMISWGCSIMDRDFHASTSGKELRASTHIGRGAWIACNVTILKGVSIGEGAIVGAGAVVTRDVPAGAIVAGNPARRITQRLELVE